ncbi:MAG: S-layer protein domain-containing protein, partial [Candidatus Methanoperedens sp.]|nr:S-layer protein domain-containing protein [Candidatus Methanoperedens sp.]
MTKKIIAVALAVLMLAVILPANAAIQATSVEIRGEVYDASPYHAPNATGCALITCNASWNGNNFAGFWYDLKDGLMSENMTINDNVSDRSILADKLLYNATMRPVEFKVSSEKDRYVENGLGGTDNLTKDFDAGTDGLNNVTGGRFYAKIGWQAEEY